MALSDLTDVTSATATDKFVLVADGSAYVGRALLETDITDGSLFARVADAETISGSWVFTATNLDANDVRARNGNQLWAFETGNSGYLNLGHDGTDATILTNLGNIHVQDAMDIDGTVTVDDDIVIDNGNKLIIWDSTTTDKMEIFHDGTDFQFSATNVQDIEIQNITGDFKIRDGAGLSLFDATDADKATFNHDGTDFNLVGFQTTDWNISGFTAIKAGTVDADFDAITATSYGGITENLLLDKAAAESITGTYSFKAAAGLKVVSGAPLLWLNETGATADNLKWAFTVNAEIFKLKAFADNEGSSGDVFVVNRTGTTVDGIDFPTAVTATSLQAQYIRGALTTTANLEDVAHSINTSAGKLNGVMVYNNTSNLPVFSQGSNDNSVWKDAAGNTVHTPV